MNCNDLNDKIHNWIDEDEEMLINKLKDYCDKYKLYCETLDFEIKAIEKNIDITSVDLLNGVNAINKLSLTKYSVFEIDTNETPAKSNTATIDRNKIDKGHILSKEEKENNTMFKYKTAINMSIDNLSIKQLKESQKKNKMKLPFIISTKDFFSHETLGMVNNIIDNELSENSVKGQDKDNSRKLSDKRRNSEKKDTNSNSQQKHFDESKTMKIKSYNLFPYRNMNEDEEDIDEIMIQKYSTSHFNQSQLNNSKAKSQISIEEFVKKGLFDIDDEENDIIPENNLFKRNVIQEPGNQLLLPIKDDSKPSKKRITEYENIKEEFQIKTNEVIADNESKKKETPIEIAKQKLKKLFDEDDDEENNDDNQIDKITEKTKKLAKKLDQYTSEQNKTNNNNNVNNNKLQTELYQIKDQQEKVIKRPLFIIEDEEDEKRYKDNKINHFLHEKKESIPKQNDTWRNKQINNNCNHNKLAFIFKEDDDDKSNEPLIIQPKLGYKDDKIKPQQEEINTTIKEELKPQPYVNKSTFEETKASLNSKLSSFPFSQVNNYNYQALNKNSQEEIHLNNLNINIQDNNVSIIKKKKPHKPLFDFIENKNINNNKKDQSSYSFNPQKHLKSESKNNISENNKIIINQKPLIKLNFSFNEDDNEE